jgi:hypothetical protein
MVADMAFCRRKPRSRVDLIGRRYLRATVALAGIVASAAAGGCAAGEQAATTTVVETTTVATTVTTSRTTTETVTAEDGLPTPTPSKRAKNEIRFSGNGDTKLSPFRVRPRGAILHWTNSGEVFSLFGREGTLVDSVANRGETFLPAGVHRIDVVASGSWVITIPRSRRVR